MAWVSGRSSKQPRLPTSESYAHKPALGGRRGSDKFWLGGRGLDIALAARRKFVCGQCSLGALADAARCLLSRLLAAQQVPRSATAGQSRFPASRLIIERIEFEGNRRIRSETLLARIFTRTGDPYNRGSPAPRLPGAVEHPVSSRTSGWKCRTAPTARTEKSSSFTWSSGPSSAASNTQGNKSDQRIRHSGRFKDRKVGLVRRKPVRSHQDQKAPKW